MRLGFQRVFWLTLLAFACSISASAQVATGAPPFATMASLPEGQINLANLNLHLVIPIVRKSGVGMPFSYALLFDSSIWNPQGGTRWALVDSLHADTEVELGYVTYSSITRSCMGELQRIYYTDYHNFAYHDPFGVTHPFSVDVADDPSGMCPVNYSQTQVAADGSGYTMYADAGPSVTVTSAAGATYSPPLQTSSGAGSVSDANGNTISVNGSGVFTDTLGQSALTVSGSEAPNGSMTFAYTEASGAQASVVVHFGSYSVTSDFAGCSAAQYSGSNIAMVSRIDLPDGTNYQFGYLSDGRLHTLALPTGGAITYAYTGGSNGITCADGSAATLTRTMPDNSIWTYQHSETGAAWTTTVTDPAGNATVYQFQEPNNPGGTATGDGFETERDAYSGGVSGPLLQTVYTCYNGAASPCSGTAITLPVASRAVTTKLDTALESKTTATFDSYGLPLTVDEYAFGSGAPGGLVRETDTAYKGFTDFERVSSIEVKDATGTQRAYTSFAYDTKGNTTSVSRWVAGSTNLTTNFTVNANGTVATMTDPRQEQTTYTYTTGTCNNAFPTSVSLPGGLSTSATWNCNVALPVAVTGVDGQATTFHYDDPFARITQIDAPGPSDGSPREAVIQYSDSTDTVDRWISTTSDSVPVPSGDAGYRHERDIADSLGRVIEHDLVNDPAGLTKTLTTYDSLGRVATVTNPYRQTTDPTYGITKYSYDALGRATAITDPDNSVTTLAYGGGVGGAGGLGTSQCGATAYPIESDSADVRPSQVWLDADGNVLEADEPNPSSGSLTSGELATCYTYTTLDQLATVSQGGQQRSLYYDGLGEMLYSRFPESAANIAGPADGFGNTNWSEALTYDADGNVATRKDADGVTTTFGYDALNRLTIETFSDSTPGRYFIYDSTTGCTLPSGANVTYSTGRLVCAGLSGTGQYNLISHDPAGEAVETWDQGPAGSPAHQAYGYFFNGQFSSYTNPNGNVFTYTLDNPGRVTKIAATWNGSETVFGGASFTPLETLASATVGPESIAASYNGNAEMTETTATIAGAKDFDRVYGYDHDGLVTSDNDGVNSAYNRSYGYDFLSRLTSMTAPNTPSANSNFVYDRWGNLYQATGSESWNVSINATTNQVSGLTYDNDGRLTNDGGNTYSWNALGLITNFNGSASSYWFDAFGRRVRAATPAGTFDYYYDVNGALRGVWNETNSTWKQLEIGLGSASLETYNAAPPAGYSNFTYTGTSLLGSTAFRYNPSAGAKNYHFLPYGLEWPGEGSDATSNLKWTGHEQDSDSGLYHFLFRNYAPLENRWLSPDPAGWIVGDPGAPGTWNRYSYVGGSPCSATDPLGLRDCPKGTHPLTSDPNALKAVLHAADALTKEGITYSESGAPGTLDCTGFIQRAIANAGYSILPASTSQIMSGTAGGAFYMTTSTPQPGAVDIFDAGAGPFTHAAIFASVSTVRGKPGLLAPGSVLYASNKHHGTRGKGGPQPFTAGPNWTGDLNGGAFYIPCIKNAVPQQRPQGTSGGGGMPSIGGGGPGDWDPFQLYDILTSSGGWTIIVTTGPPKEQ
ncbi:MAG: RHS repeat domain-containing protein [Terriglobales bacterium]